MSPSDLPRADVPPGSPRLRLGYVLKMYPRFSETFVVNEVLALEAAGQELDIFSLRLPDDGHFHESLADVQAPVTYLPYQVKPPELWEVLCRGAATLPALPVHLHDLLDLPPFEACSAVELAVQARRRGITHLHAHFASVATDVARLAAQLTGLSYSFTAHAKDIYHVSVQPERLRRKLADAAAVVTVSDHNVRYLRDTYGTAATNVVRVYNGLDLTRFGFALPDRRPPVVAAVGRLVEKKGFAHLLDALALLVREGRVVRLDLVGTGDQEEALRAQVTRLRLDAHVRFLGAQPQVRVKEIVRDAAALAAPCVLGADGNRDGLPTVLLEAMALGTPCVSTPVTGIPEAVQHEHTGLLVPEADPVALARALGRLLDDETLRRRLSVNARALVEQRFDIRRTSTALRHALAAAVQPTPGTVMA